MPSFLKRAAQRVRRGASHSNGVESAVVDGAASAVSAGATAVDMTAEVRKSDELHPLGPCPLWRHTCRSFRATRDRLQQWSQPRLLAAWVRRS